LGYSSMIDSVSVQKKKKKKKTIKMCNLYSNYITV
jgi:hypothetical protein